MVNVTTEEITNNSYEIIDVQYNKINIKITRMYKNDPSIIDVIILTLPEFLKIQNFIFRELIKCNTDT